MSMPLLIAYNATMIPAFAIVLGILGIALPSAMFRVAAKWSERQPDLSSVVLTGAIVISGLGILTAGVITLAMLGWLPPPNHWLR